MSGQEMDHASSGEYVVQLFQYSGYIFFSKFCMHMGQEPLICKDTYS